MDYKGMTREELQLIKEIEKERRACLNDIMPWCFGCLVVPAVFVSVMTVILGCEPPSNGVSNPDSIIENISKAIRVEKVPG